MPWVNRPILHAARKAARAWAGWSQKASRPLGAFPAGPGGAGRAELQLLYSAPQPDQPLGHRVELPSRRLEVLALGADEAGVGGDRLVDAAQAPLDLVVELAGEGGHELLAHGLDLL